MTMPYEAMRDRLADMTREARLSREATEKAVRREAEGWASYAAEQERHGQLVAALRETLDRYATDGEPEQCEPEDRWRLFRDLRALLPDEAP